MWNIIIGIAFIVGGLSGKFVLRGTDSSNLLAIVGGGLIIWGIFQMVKGKKSADQEENTEPTTTEDESEESSRED